MNQELTGQQPNKDPKQFLNGFIDRNRKIEDQVLDLSEARDPDDFKRIAYGQAGQTVSPDNVSYYG